MEEEGALMMEQGSTMVAEVRVVAGTALTWMVRSSQMVFAKSEVGLEASCLSAGEVWALIPQHGSLVLNASWSA